MVDNFDGIQTMNNHAAEDVIIKMEQADVNDNVITTATSNPNYVTEDQPLITRIDNGTVTPTEQQVSEAHKKAEAAIKPKTGRHKRKTKPRRKKA
jgi:hypothetical protein